MLLQFIINGIITGLLYSLLAIGFALVYRTTRIFHISAAAVFVFSAYMFWWLADGSGLSLWLSAALVSSLSMVLSLLSEILVYRPLRNRKTSLNLIMVASIGLMTVIVNIIAMLFGNGTRVINTPVSNSFRLENVTITASQLVLALVSVVSMVALLFMLGNTRLGLKFQAISSDEVLLESLGVDRNRIVTILFLLSGLFIGLSGCLTVLDMGLNPNIGMTFLINAMVAMIVGGNGNYLGCIVGGLVLGLVQAFTVYLFDASWQNAVAFALLLFFLFFRPQGIVGYKQRTV